MLDSPVCTRTLAQQALCALALMALSGAHAATGEANLQLEGTGAYFTVHVPLPIQEQATFSDLRDIQVLNARGERLPFAWADDADVPKAVETRQSVPFFQTPAATPASQAAQPAGWIIDTRNVPGMLLKLHLAMPNDTHGLYGFALESSADLQQWQVLKPSVQLLSLEHKGQHLDNSSIDLGAVQARYLRLQPPPGGLTPPLSGVQVSNVTHLLQGRTVQWSEPLTATQCGPTWCDYTLPRNMPLEQLQVLLSEPNTLAPVQLLGWNEAWERSSHRATPGHRLRDHLKDLRNKTAPSGEADEALPWRFLSESTVYWLRLPEGEVRSENLWLQGEQFTQLRLQSAGGIDQLGSQRPSIRVGSRARSLVFLARGTAPYRLAWGGTTPAPARMSLAKLLPTRQPADPLPDAAATVLSGPLPQPEMLPPPASASAVAFAPPATVPSRRLWLWGVLLLALSLMGFMAWSLLKRPAAPST